MRGARRFAVDTVGSALRGAPIAEAPADVDAVAADVALVTSELASNAVRHAATPFEVVLDFGGGHVRIEVRDGSAAAPPQHPPVPGGATGRGLVVVDRLASSWGVEATRPDKVVWAEVPVGVLAREPLG